jgi:hypothetical protein
MNRTGPRQLRSCICTFSEEESARVRCLIAKLGTVRAALRVLGVSKSTLDAARDCGRIERKTRDRLLETLARAEAAA